MNSLARQSLSHTNVLQCGTPLATYAHLALAEPIAHPGRGMPVLSSTVHIARHACSKLGPDDFWLPFRSPLHGEVLCLTLEGGHIGGAFLAAGHAKTQLLYLPQVGCQSGKTSVR